MIYSLEPPLDLLFQAAQTEPVPQSHQEGGGEVPHEEREEGPGQKVRQRDGTQVNSLLGQFGKVLIIRSLSTQARHILYIDERGNKALMYYCYESY